MNSWEEKDEMDKFPISFMNTMLLQLHALPSEEFRGLLSAELSLWTSSVQFSLVHLLSCVWLFAIPWTAARQASLSITNTWSWLKLMSIVLVMPPNHSILCHPLSSLLHSFPAWGSFQMSQFFTSSDQSNGASASASVFPMNIQDWFPLGWTGWISLQSKELSRVFPNNTVQKHQYFSFLHSPTLTSIHEHWKNHSHD